MANLQPPLHGVIPFPFKKLYETVYSEVKEYTIKTGASETEQQRVEWFWESVAMGLSHHMPSDPVHRIQVRMVGDLRHLREGEEQFFPEGGG